MYHLFPFFLIKGKRIIVESLETNSFIEDFGPGFIRDHCRPLVRTRTPDSILGICDPFNTPLSVYYLPSVCKALW